MQQKKRVIIYNSIYSWLVNKTVGKTILVCK